MGANNGWTGYKLFNIKSTMGGGRVLYVSNDGSILLPSERYIKLRKPKNNDEEKFYYDSKTKQIKSFLYPGYVITSRV
jgi:hypothetical protein